MTVELNWEGCTINGDTLSSYHPISPISLISYKISNSEISHLYDTGLKCGADGGKLLGAGGGGFGLILGPIDVLNKLKREFTDILFFDIELDELGSRQPSTFS